MWNEIKVAARGLAKTPALAAVAILTVALALGANSAVFSLVNALLSVALLASYIPALRATKADPMIALGHNA